MGFYNDSVNLHLYVRRCGQIHHRAFCGTVRENLPCQKFLILSSIPDGCSCRHGSMRYLADNFHINGEKFRIKFK
ncbi:hypothetical protein M5D96_008970 [Drosophila gunungcola]|uniref:Uncharacterized protein n=1 Tax=Drosophila gunungcola TaxID=103775 RepID=A0A9P9YKB4_9MUSC|nr:hypothetical protein M5D96_008970 [Drosophila gunungcola]